MTINDVPTAHYDRRVVLDGTFNTRDLGGLTKPGGSIRRGRLLRSDGLHDLSDSDRSHLAALGLRTVVDLRSDEERAERVSSLTGLDVEVVALPIGGGQIDPDLDAMPTLREAYETIVDAGAPALASAINRLAEPDALPALVHCTAGKDRTGVLIALVLSMIGVDDETIVADYSISGPQLGQAFAEQLGAAGGFKIDDAALADMLSSPAGLLRDVFADVRARFGSVQQYLVSNGLADDAAATLRHHLVDTGIDTSPTNEDGR